VLENTFDVKKPLVHLKQQKNYGFDRITSLLAVKIFRMLLRDETLCLSVSAYNFNAKLPHNPREEKN
jgi:hypothetical protein